MKHCICAANYIVNLIIMPVSFGFHVNYNKTVKFNFVNYNKTVKFNFVNCNKTEKFNLNVSCGQYYIQLQVDL